MRFPHEPLCGPRAEARARELLRGGVARGRRPGAGPARRTGFRGVGGGAPASVIYEADFSTLSAGAIGAMPGGLSFARSGDAYSVQSGTSALITATYSTDQARAGRNLDTDPIALVFEEARTNIVKRSRELATFPPWSTSGTASRTAGVANGPDGSTNSADRHQANSGARVLLYNDAASGGGLAFSGSGVRAAFSSWIRGLVGGESYQMAVVNDGLTAGICKGGTLTTSWVRDALSVVAGTDTGTDTSCFGSIAFGDAGNSGSKSGGIAAGARDVVGDCVQCEEGGFPTEYITTTTGSVTRNGERLYHTNAGAFVRSGVLKIEFALKPKGATSRYSGTPYLWKIGSDTATFDPASGLITITINGAAYTTAVGMSWSEGDSVDIYIEAGACVPFASYRVNSGASILLSTGSPAAQTALASSGDIDLLCNGTASQFTAWVREIRAYA